MLLIHCTNDFDLDSSIFAMISMKRAAMALFLLESRLKIWLAKLRHPQQLARFGAKSMEN